MLDYSQTRSFNLGIAKETSVEAALIYNDFVYAQQTFGDGWFYRSYEQLLNRLPIASERTMRNAVNQLEASGWIEKKVMKKDGKPICHYKICRFLSAKSAETMESAKSAETIYDSNTKETKTRSKLEAELISLVNKVTGRNFRTLPERGVKKTLDSFSLVEIETALRALVADDWHAERLNEFKIDYLIRATTIDKFLGMAKDVLGDNLPMTQEEKDALLAAETTPEVPMWETPNATE